MNDPKLAIQFSYLMVELRLLAGRKQAIKQANKQQLKGGMVTTPFGKRGLNIMLDL